MLPGAIVATVVLEATFQVAADLPAASPTQRLGSGVRRARVLLLLWLYVMANVIVFGAEINWSAVAVASAARSAARRPAPVRVDPLPVVAELGDRPRLALGDEHRVVAKAARAARLGRDLPSTTPTASTSRPSGPIATSGRHPRVPVGRVAEPFQQLRGAAAPLAAQRAECTPGLAASASTSIPESSPSTQASPGPTARPYSALSRALS